MNSLPLLVAGWVSLFCSFTLHSAEVFYADLALPETLEIQVAGKMITGYRSNPDGILEEEMTPWKEEGFIYRPNFEHRDRFEVIAWSSKGHAGEILALAEVKLLEIIAEKNPDQIAGHAKSGTKSRQLAQKKRKYQKGLTVITSPKLLAPNQP